MTTTEMMVGPSRDGHINYYIRACDAEIGVVLRQSPGILFRLIALPPEEARREELHGVECVCIGSKPYGVLVATGPSLQRLPD